MVAVDLQPFLAAEAKERQRAAGGNRRKKSASGKNSGSPAESGSNGEARQKVAEMVHVNPHYISDAKRIKKVSPKLAEEVRDGRISLPGAKKALNEQRHITSTKSGDGVQTKKKTAQTKGRRQGKPLVLKPRSKPAGVAAAIIGLYGQRRALEILVALTELLRSADAPATDFSAPSFDGKQSPQTN